MSREVAVDFGEGHTCPSAGGCGSCPCAGYCRGLRVGLGLTTEMDEKLARDWPYRAGLRAARELKEEA